MAFRLHKDKEAEGRLTDGQMFTSKITHHNADMIDGFQADNHIVELF